MVKDYKSDIRILAEHLKLIYKSEDSTEAFTKNLCELKAPRGYNTIKMDDLKGKNAKEVAEVIIESYTGIYWKAKVMEALKMSNKNQIRLNLKKALNADKKKAPNKAKAGSGEVNVADQKNFEAGESSKTLKSQKSGGDVKPKIESDSTEPSIVKVQVSGEAVGHKQKTEEEKEENVKSKTTRKQPPRGKKHFVIEKRNSLIKVITHVDPVLDDLMEEKLLTQEQYDTIRKKSTNQNKMRELFDYVRSWGPKDLDKFQRILRKHNLAPIKNLLEKCKQKK
ncbi:baculoviral IAP repeat-containing protein 2-like [Hyla sarda]|uniref:baculoviral IAP repeat-containing protein 2-like n=1 Tax=Hyla sarda TaxID=327740 RepID=UPI0024C3212A|nr:baculoviral IAP repeat-containing protein 2-like [Hyla sarda]XP_056392811.1 baculoviral IAP repeat-containing protein 2-like [Hyla sarda]